MWHNGKVVVRQRRATTLVECPSGLRSTPRKRVRATPSESSNLSSTANESPGIPGAFSLCSVGLVHGDVRVRSPVEERREAESGLFVRFLAPCKQLNQTDESPGRLSEGGSRMPDTRQRRGAGTVFTIPYADLVIPPVFQRNSRSEHVLS